MFRNLLILTVCCLLGLALAAKVPDSAIATGVKSSYKCPCKCYFGKHEYKAYKECQYRSSYCAVLDCYGHGYPYKGKYCCNKPIVTTVPPTTTTKPPTTTTTKPPTTTTTKPPTTTTTKPPTTTTTKPPTTTKPKCPCYCTSYYLAVRQCKHQDHCAVKACYYGGDDDDDEDDDDDNDYHRQYECCDKHR